MLDRSEIGGEFHWMGLPQGPCVPLPGDTRWFSLGRTAIQQVLQSTGASRIWVPDYFCEPVVAELTAFAEIVRYVDNPLRDAPDWSTLRAESGDVVLAMHYFGMARSKVWQEWSRTQSCLVLDDYSHDPAYGFLRSRADFAMASLRKTCPVPDGGILWSPAGHPLPPVPTAAEGRAAGMKLAAMIWKTEYLLHRAPDEAKTTFREWQLQSEDIFIGQGLSAPAVATTALLQRGIPLEWLQQRRANDRFLRACLKGLPGIQVLESGADDLSTPFAVVLLCQSHSLREALRQTLISQQIYCPVHWPPTETSSSDAVRLSALLLTLVCDQRYGENEMRRMALLVRKVCHEQTISTPFSHDREELLPYPAEPAAVAYSEPDYSQRK